MTSIEGYAQTVIDSEGGDPEQAVRLARLVLDRPGPKKSDDGNWDQGELQLGQNFKRKRRPLFARVVGIDRTSGVVELQIKRKPGEPTRMPYHVSFFALTADWARQTERER